MSEIEQKCDACGRSESEVRLIVMGLSVICEDPHECIAEFSGWNKHPDTLAEEEIEGAA